MSFVVHLVVANVGLLVSTEIGRGLVIGPTCADRPVKGRTERPTGMAPQPTSGSMTMAPQGHSLTQMPHPLQKS